MPSAIAWAGLRTFTGVPRSTMCPRVGCSSPNNADATAFRKLFADAQPITFRYGYPDNKSHGHIVVTRR